MTAFARMAARMTKGGYSPCPVGRDGRPAVKWEKLREEHLPLDQIQWLADKRPECSLSVVCGYQGLIAADIDTDDPEIIAAIQSALPEANVKRRGSKGYAAFYRDPTGGLKNRNFAPKGSAPLVEVKANMTITIPPSLHRVTRHPYVWLTSQTLFNTRVEDLVDLTEADLLALERAMGKWCPPKPAYAPKVCMATKPVSDIRMRAYAQAALGRVVAALSGLTGGRNAALNKAAFTIGKYVQHDVLTYAEFEEDLLAACHTNGSLKKRGIAQCKLTIASGYEAAANHELPVLPDREWSDPGRAPYQTQRGRAA